MMSEYHELSNFFKCPITYKEKLFNCCEQAYRHSKAVVFGDKEAAEAIMRTPDPARQKFLGSKINGFVFDQWKRDREAIMSDILHCKFSQHLDLC